MGGFWLGMAQGMQEHKEQKAQQTMAHAKEQKELLLKLIEQARQGAVPEAYGTLDQFAQQVIAIDTMKPNALKQLAKLAQQIPTTFMSTKTVAPVRADLNVTLAKAPMQMSDVASKTRQITAPGGAVQPTGGRPVTIAGAGPVSGYQFTETQPYRRGIAMTPQDAVMSQLAAKSMAFPMEQQMYEAQQAAQTERMLQVERLKALFKEPPKLTDWEKRANGYAQKLYGKDYAELDGTQKVAVDEEMRKSQTPNSLNELADLYEQENLANGMEPQAARIKAVEDARQFISESAFNRANPTESIGTTQWKVAQILNDFSNYPKLTTGNKMAKRQVDAMLADAGVNIHALTASTKQLGETAKTLIPKLQHIADRLRNPKYAEQIGPVSGRLNEMLLKVAGTADPEFVETYNQGILAITGTMRAHMGSRGGQMMFDHFQELLNVPVTNAATLSAALDAIVGFLQGYADAAYPGYTAASVGKLTAPEAPTASPSTVTDDDIDKMIDDAFNRARR